MKRGAFWLSSPLMDPSMFFLTVGPLGLGFALYKTFAAVAVGLIGGYGIFFLIHGGGLSNSLREGVGSGGCGGTVLRNPKQVEEETGPEVARHLIADGVDAVLLPPT